MCKGKIITDCENKVILEEKRTVFYDENQFLVLKLKFQRWKSVVGAKKVIFHSFFHNTQMQVNAYLAYQQQNVPNTNPVTPAASGFFGQYQQQERQSNPKK